MRKDTKFEQGLKQVKVFEDLRNKFNKESILRIFDPEREIIVEIDVSDFAIGAILAQKGKDRRTRLVKYYLRKLKPIELNYPIYNKEILVIIEVFIVQRLYLEELKHEVLVITDYLNLIYFKIV